jgi:AmmeMemoRadiSam system protein A
MQQEIYMDSTANIIKGNFFFHIYVLIFILSLLLMPFTGGPPVFGGTHEITGKEIEMPDTDKLTDKEGKFLLSVARKTIEKRLFGGEEKNSEDKDLSEKFSERRGTFVTLTIHKGLRGCIGHIIPQETLLEGVQINAINAAFQDPRFPPITKKEWDNVRIEVSILTEPKELEYADSEDLLKSLRSGVDGVILKKGYRQATFLPQVWEQLPDKEEFLMHLCMKAGLDEFAWRDEKLEVSVYQVQAFEEH